MNYKRLCIKGVGLNISVALTGLTLTRLKVDDGTFFLVQCYFYRLRSSPLLGLQSRCGDKVLGICVVCPLNGAAVLNGSNERLLLRGTIVSRTKFCE